MGVEKPVQFPMASHAAHEHADKFAKESFKIAAHVGALNSSAALLCTAVQKMAREGGQGTDGAEPAGLSPAQCQTAFGAISPRQQHHAERGPNSGLPGGTVRGPVPLSMARLRQI